MTCPLFDVDSGENKMYLTMRKISIFVLQLAAFVKMHLRVD
jgi:hypothetical protein